MTKRNVLKQAQTERNRVPLGDYAGFARAQEQVRRAYEALARD